MLRRILLIAKRDYTAAVMTKAFLIGLVVLPLMMGSGLIGFALLRVTQSDSPKRIAIVDHTGTVAAAISRAAEIQTAEDKAQCSARQHGMGQGVAHQAHPPDHQDRADRSAADRQCEASDQRAAHKPELGEGAERGLVQCHLGSAGVPPACGRDARAPGRGPRFVAQSPPDIWRARARLCGVSTCGVTPQATHSRAISTVSGKCARTWSKSCSTAWKDGVSSAARANQEKSRRNVR